MNFNKTVSKQREVLSCGSKAPTIAQCGIDAISSTAAVRTIGVYHYQIPIGILRKSLIEALADAPALCSRLKEDVKGQPYFAVEDQGIEFVVWEYPQAMPAYDLEHPIKADADKYTVKLGFNPTNKDQALVGIKISYFSDGMIIGFSSTHCLLDGASQWLFLQHWANRCQALSDSDTSYATTPIPTERAGMVALTTSLDKTKDSGLSINHELSSLGFVGFIAKCMLSMATSQRIIYKLSQAQLKQAATDAKQAFVDSPDWISTQDVVMASIFRVYALVSDADTLHAGTIYNLRNVEGLGLSKQFLGNATTARSITLATNTVVDDISQTALAFRRISQTVTLDNVLQDLAYLNDKMHQGKAIFQQHEVVRNLFTQGILINNYSKFAVYETDFGAGSASWGDYPNVPLPRYANVMPDPNGDGVIVHLTLPRAEMKRLLELSENRRGFATYTQC